MLVNDKYPIWSAVCIVVLGAVFTYFVHGPSIGIDDANITQNYAQNIADGLGYVYYEGGERVEGSTSLLWTIINVIFFSIFDVPEIFIAGFCLALTVLTVAESLNLLRHLSDKFEVPFIITSVLLSCFLISYPSFFSWTIWALMDTTLWVFSFTLIVCRFIMLILTQTQVPMSKSSIVLVCGGLLFLPFVRPEGIAISIGFTALFLIYAYVKNLVLLRTSLLGTLAIIGALIASVTFWRLQYFGYPVPNTFYAKVSVDIVNQIVAGVKYLARYLVEPMVMTSVTLSLGFVALAFTKGNLSKEYASWLAITLLSSIFGIFALYVVLGGDHFGSARQFQVLTPLLSILAAFSLGNMIHYLYDKSAMRDGGLSKKWYGPQILIGCLILISLVIFAKSTLKYAANGGSIDHEFRIAENGREIGHLLNDLPGELSIGVITAGGVARAYGGPIYDLMGLNWVEMAHSNRLHSSSSAKNHAAFSSVVFFSHYPDIVLPRLSECRTATDDEIRSSFSNFVLGGLLLDARFKRVYVRACFKEATFYIKRDLLEGLGSLLGQPG